MKKIIIIFLFSILLLGISKYVYDVHFNFNFEEVSKNKVYKSGVIPPEKIAKYIEEHQLKSVIDLRFPHTKDKINNPEIPEQLIAEKLAVEKLDGVNYFNLGTDQVPTQDTVDEFLEIMDDLSNYPVLIHCYHGVGRAKCFRQYIELNMKGILTKKLEKKQDSC